MNLLVVATSHPSLNFFASTWNIIKQFMASFSDENIILQTDTTKVLEAFHLLLDEELGSGRISHGRNNGVLVEVHTRFAGDDHARDERTSGTKLADARLLDALVATREASDIVGVEANEVTKTVRHEDSAHVLLHHLLDVANEEAALDQLGETDALSKTVHVRPHHARLHLCLDAALHSKHSLVDITLVLSELAVCREGGGQITIIAVVFAAAIDENHITILDLTVVGESSVAVVKGGSVGTAGTDGSVADVAAATVEVAVVEEGRLELVLVHARLDGAHDSLVCLSSHADDIAHDLDLSRALADTAFSKVGNKLATVNAVGVKALELNLGVWDAAVGVDTRENVDDLRITSSNRGRKLIDKLAVIDLVLGLVERRRLNLAENDLKRFGKARDEESCETLHVDGGIEVRLHDTKEILEVALLLEDKLDITIIDWFAVTTTENKKSRIRNFSSLETLQKTLTVVLMH